MQIPGQSTAFVLAATAVALQDGMVVAAGGLLEVHLGDHAEHLGGESDPFDPAMVRGHQGAHLVQNHREQERRRPDLGFGRQFHPVPALRDQPTGRRFGDGHAAGRQGDRAVGDHPARMIGAFRPEPTIVREGMPIGEQSRPIETNNAFGAHPK